MHERATGIEVGNQRACSPLHRPIGASFPAQILTRRLSKLTVLVLALAILTLLFSAPQGGAQNAPKNEYEAATEAYFQENKRVTAEKQEEFRTRISIPDALSPDVPLSRVISNMGDAPASRESLIAAAERQRSNLILIGVVVLLLALFARKLAPIVAEYLNQQFNPWALKPANGVDLSAKSLAEDNDFAEFLTAFQSGTAATGASPFGNTSAAETLREFFRRMPRYLETMRTQLQQIDQSSSRTARRKILCDLQRDLRDLKSDASAPELLPIWQMISGLEGLVKQLIDQIRNVTPSTLRTVHGGVDVLESLCVPNLNPNLFTQPPFKLLVVDDDLISRKALSFALKKALTEPDQAENGEAGLSLAMDHAYDVIFLDVQMPGMDGFELCQKIRETAVNQVTPIVFVTCQSDFESRAQSTLVGGNDLIAKPFLTFEITVKALTLAAQARLRNGAQPAQSPASTPAADRLTLAFRNPEPEIVAPTPLPPSRANVVAMPAPAEVPVAPVSDDLAKKFLTRAAANVGPMRELIQAILQSTEKAEHQDRLADLYLNLHAITPDVEAVKAHPAFRICSRLESLVKKLLKSPEQSSTSAMLTISSAVDLLAELCQPGIKTDLASNPPIELLVVDDDPVARRAITFALQLSFKKPDSVESGEAAVAAASEKTYDAIFLDIQMPGMDGFAACTKIRETAQNRMTPVVFVTAHGDLKARTQSTLSGGNELVGKPILPAEITLKALTFALRNRIQKIKVMENVVTLSPEAEAQALADNRRRRPRSEKQARRR